MNCYHRIVFVCECCWWVVLTIVLFPFLPLPTFLSSFLSLFFNLAFFLTFLVLFYFFFIYLFVCVLRVSLFFSFSLLFLLIPVLLKDLARSKCVCCHCGVAWLMVVELWQCRSIHNFERKKENSIFVSNLFSLQFGFGYIVFPSIIIGWDLTTRLVFVSLGLVPLGVVG